MGVLSFFGVGIAWLWRPWQEFRNETDAAERSARDEVYGHPTE
jgi:hypothetical protein